MSAKTIQSQGAGLVLALGLGLATMLGVAGLARAEFNASQVPVAAQMIDNNFVCHAHPGGWCDLRDWRGMDNWAEKSPASLSN
jgi:L,D-peptidoglycan transpeptidase YkuD (ErfK/YbiS/YcfS/YnhG family)